MASYEIPPPELADLLQGCSRNEAGAQRRLYERMYPFALSVALHYATDRSEAEEITHDAFLKLFRALGDQPFAGNFHLFFRRIIVNTGIDYYRSRKRRRSLLERIMPATQPSVANEAVRDLGQEDVLCIVQRLSPGYRLVFNLYVVEGFSHPEISERLGISVSTSKSNLAKARRALSKIVDQYFIPDNPSDRE
ncbi:RNA polymerase sigma factor [Lewinella sp. IMCC34191]|uniref:RNA polymerase sigma factor n=1 Tax=Lewinella sp. IMCC34191 TaxID=2259172 RepID=UPI001300620D|nr:sigma-70 family RNA polymerase sigma factor [Lewinella sp. IMCC34191]